jgi:hypothetical protein
MSDPAPVPAKEYHQQRMRYLKSRPNPFKHCKLTGPGYGDRVKPNGPLPKLYTNGRFDPMTVRQISMRKRVGLNTVYSWIRRGKLQMVEVVS